MSIAMRRGVGAIASSGNYVVNAVTFDGTNDWLEAVSGYTGIADSGIFSFSIAFRRDGTGLEVLKDINTRFRIEFDASDNLHIIGRDTSNVLILEYTSTATYTDTNWHSLLISMDLSDTGKRDVYIDDSSVAGTYGTYTNDSISFVNLAGAAIGANAAGGSKFDGDMAEFWFEDGAYLGFSTESNRRKFIDDNGKPVFLGNVGQLPLGTTPLIFQSGDTSTWHTNLGSGGGLTENGALTTASTSPSN